MLLQLVRVGGGLCAILSLGSVSPSCSMCLLVSSLEGKWILPLNSSKASTL